MKLYRLSLVIFCLTLLVSCDKKPVINLSIKTYVNEKNSITFTSINDKVDNVKLNIYYDDSGNSAALAAAPRPRPICKPEACPIGQSKIKVSILNGKLIILPYDLPQFAPIEFSLEGSQNDIQKVNGFERTFEVAN
jgi:hypothetical protein